MVSDEAIYLWQRRLIREEGIFTEPAGAAALAGLAGWTIETRQPRGEVWCVAYSPDSKWLALGDSGGCVRTTGSCEIE